MSAWACQRFVVLGAQRIVEELVLGRNNHQVLVSIMWKEDIWKLVGQELVGTLRVESHGEKTKGLKAEGKGSKNYGARYSTQTFYSRDSKM